MASVMSKDIFRGSGLRKQQLQYRDLIFFFFAKNLTIFFSHMHGKYAMMSLVDLQLLLKSK